MNLLNLSNPSIRLHVSCFVRHHFALRRKELIEKHIAWVNLVLELWLIVSPLLSGYYTAGGPTIFDDVLVVNDLIVGFLLADCSWWILASLQEEIWPAPTVSRRLGASAMQAAL
jgi:hypothetical protein